MRVALAYIGTPAFTVETPYESPLGGSQSAMCYLAEALAQRGHEVYLLSSIAEPTESRGVRCLRLSNATVRALPRLDAFVVQNLAGQGALLRSLLPAGTRLMLWSQHAHDQPAMQALHDSAERDVYDKFALISDWQRGEYLREFGVDPSRVGIMRNAISPSFQNLVPVDGSILATKAKLPVLAYTSTPFRGLEVLLDVFPTIRATIPGVKLRVFSSMQVYHTPEHEDRENFGPLYRRCRETEGVEYIGSLSQPKLAQEMKSVTMLAYPNTFAETSCIAAMEAMAAGCIVVTSALGALPETTAGFARLVRYDGVADQVYQRRFVEETVRALMELTGASATVVDSELRRQVKYVNEDYTWPARAKEWEEWLNK